MKKSYIPLFHLSYRAFLDQLLSSSDLDSVAIIGGLGFFVFNLLYKAMMTERFFTLKQQEEEKLTPRQATNLRGKSENLFKLR